MHRFSDWMLGCFFAEDEGGGGSGTGGGKGEGGQGGQGGVGAEDKPKSYDEAYVGGLRRENADHRTKLRETERRLKELEDAKLSDAEKLQKRAEDGEKTVTTLRTRVARAEVKVAAVDAKIIDPDAAYRLIKDEIEFDAEGEPTNVPALLEQLAKDKPYLVGDGRSVDDHSSPGAPGNRRAGGGQTFTRSQIADRAFYVAHEAAIHAAMAAGRIIEG